MRHLVSALAACIVLTGSVALAAPRAGRHGKVTRKAKHRAKIVAPPVDATDGEDEDADAAEEAAPKARLSGSGRSRAARATTDTEDEDEDEAEEAPPKARASGKRSRTARATFDREDDDLADEAEVDVAEPPVKLRRVAAKRASDWHLAVGPYLWASSVDANVSLGGASVSSGVDFAEISHHARYGAELLAEVRYRRFSIASDFMYGVVDLAGVRYQRTSIEATVGLGGSDVASTEKVMAGADAIAGGRVVVRPFNRFYLSSTFDVGVFGSSSLTWSVAADASARITSRVLLSVGYRTLTLEGASVSMVMHGPRAAVQLVF